MARKAKWLAGFDRMVEKDLQTIRHILKSSASVDSVRIARKAEYNIYEDGLYFSWDAGEAALLYRGDMVFRCIP